MQLENIKIEGFRGIPELTVSDLGMVNLLVGRNNCSKTSMLEAIFLLTGGGNPEVIFKINGLRNLVFIEPEDLRLIFHNLDYDSQLKIAGQYKEKGKTREILIKPGKRTVQSKSLGANKNGYPDFLEINTVTGEPTVSELVLELKTKTPQSQTQTFTSSVVFAQNEFVFTPPKNYKEDLKALFLASNTMALSATLEKRLENYIINKREKDIIETLKAVEPNISGISLGTNKMIYVDIGISRLIPLNLMGDGIRRVLSIVLGIAESNNGVVLIDEIDNGLHFSVMVSLWKAVLKASKTFKVQVFATTHNFEAIKYLKDVLENEDFEPLRENVRSITLRRMQDNSLKPYNYNFEKLSYAIEQGVEFR